MRNRLIVPAVLLIIACVSGVSGQMVPMAVMPASQDSQRVAGLQVENTPVLQALDLLLKDTPRSYRLAPGIRVDGVVTVNIQDVPLDTAVTIVLRSAGLQAVRDGDTYVISALKVPAAMVAQQTSAMSPAGPIGSVDVKPSAGRPGGRTFDILLDKANVLEAIRQILEVSGQNYVIDTGLDCAWAGPLGPRISSRMRGIGLDEAIEALARSSSLVMVKVGATYTIRPPDGAMPLSYAGSQRQSGLKNVPPGGIETPPVCGRCSRQITPGWIFCPFCGTRLQLVMPAAK